MAPTTWLAKGMVSIRWEAEGLRVVYNSAMEPDFAFIPWEEVAKMASLVNPSLGAAAKAAGLPPLLEEPTEESPVEELILFFVGISNGKFY